MGASRIVISYFVSSVMIWQLSSFHRVQPSWNNPLQHLVLRKKLMSIWRMIASHRYVGAEGCINMS